MQNYVTSFAVGKTGGGANTGTTLDTIKKGDILVVNYETGAILTGGSNTVDNAPVIAIASCIEDGKPILSGPIFGKKLVGGSTQAYVAPAYTKKGFGYTSASTTLTLPTVSTAEVFNFSVVMKTDLRLKPNKQDRYDYSVLSLGAYDLAHKAKISVNSSADINPKLAGQDLFYANITSNGSAANVGTAATATVSKGSRKVTFGAAHGRSVGDILYFPAAGVFKVAAVDSATVLTLDAAYHGPSEVIAADTVKVRTTVTLFGVEIVANEIKPTNPVDKYHQLDFEIGLSENFGLSEVTITAYKPGKGIGWQVRDKEIACMGWTGYTDRNDVMRAPYPFQTDHSRSYRTVEIQSNAPVRGDLQQEFIAPQAVFMAFDNAAATQSNAVLTILTPWAASGGVTV